MRARAALTWFHGGVNRKASIIVGVSAALSGASALYACGSGGSSANPGADASTEAATDDAASADSGGEPDTGGGPGGGTDSGGSDGGGDAADGAASSCLGGDCNDILTEHFDNARTGLYAAETKLNPTNVNQAMFGKLFELPVDGKVDAQPLYVEGVAVDGKGTHDVLYVVTEHDSVYAFDAATEPDAGGPLWSTTALAAGEAPSDARGCGQVTPEIGITATPVIDLATSTMYFVAMSKAGSVYHQRLHAIDLASGAEKFGGPHEVTATYPGSTTTEGNGTTLTFAPAQHKERSALLLDHGRLYTSWSSHCDIGPYTGWVIAHDPATLANVAVYNTEPGGSEGSFWNAGAGPAADLAGDVYHESANGGFETTLNAQGFPSKSDYGNSFVKLTLSGGSLSLVDYFAMDDEVHQSAGDIDLGSGGLTLLPDTVGSAAHPHLLIGGGKDGHLYLLDRDNLGKFSADGGNSQIVQDVLLATGPTETSGTGEFGAGAYFDGALYYGGVAEPLKRWPVAQARVTTPPSSQTAVSFKYPGTTPSISYDGKDLSTAIVWAHENTSPPTLHAYSAADLTVEYYSSAQAAGQRDVPTGAGNKFMIPVVANGRVYVGTASSVVVYGLR